MRTTFLTLLGLLLCSTSFAQRAQFDEQHRLVCSCKTTIVKTIQFKNCIIKSHGNCFVTIYSPCPNPNCKKTWENHYYSGIDHPVRLYSNYEEKSKKEKTHKKAFEGSCYVIDRQQENGIERWIIDNKCGNPLRCTIEGKTKVYLINKGESKTIIARMGEHLKLKIDHEQPSLK